MKIDFKVFQGEILGENIDVVIVGEDEKLNCYKCYNAYDDSIILMDGLNIQKCSMYLHKSLFEEKLVWRDEKGWGISICLEVNDRYLTEERLSVIKEINEGA